MSASDESNRYFGVCMSRLYDMTCDSLSVITILVCFGFTWQPRQCTIDAESVVWFRQCMSEPPGCSPPLCYHSDRSSWSWIKLQCGMHDLFVLLLLCFTLFSQTAHHACSPPPLPTQHAAPNPVVKLSLLDLRDSRTPSASCRAESGPLRAAGIRRLLSQMRPHVFRWSFVFFLILLWFRLSCRTLRRVQALKCD